MERGWRAQCARKLSQSSSFSMRECFVLPVAAETRTYTVKAGDTVYLLAKRFGLTTQQLIAMNDLEAPYEIYRAKYWWWGWRRALSCAGEERWVVRPQLG